MLPRIFPLLVAALCAGCASTPKPRDQQAPSPAAPNRELAQATQLTHYISDLQTMVQGNPTERAEIVARAREGYEQSKLAPAALRYGLLLAAPGHAGRDPARAHGLLLEALAHPELLTVAEQGLAVLQLAQVDAEVKLTTEIERLVADLQRERERQGNEASNAALTRLLQSEKEETARLGKALAEARAKLDAITRMESRFSDRPAAPEGRNP